MMYNIEDSGKNQSRSQSLNHIIVITWNVTCSDAQTKIIIIIPYNHIIQIN